MKNMLSETCTSLVTGNVLTNVIGSGHCPLVHFNLPGLVSLLAFRQTSQRGIPAPHKHSDLPTVTSHFALSTISELAGPSTQGSTPFMHVTVFNKQLPYCHKEPDIVLIGWPYLSSWRGPMVHGQPCPDSPAAGGAGEEGPGVLRDSCFYKLPWRRSSD